MISACQKADTPGEESQRPGSQAGTSDATNSVDSESTESTGVVRAQLSETAYREMLKGERDFRIKVTPSGDLTARCKSCDRAMRIADREGVVWFKCEECRRVSFDMAANVQREARTAKLDGKDLEYELFFMQQLPPGWKPPF